MLVPKILVLAGTARAGSANARLAALAAKELALAGADVDRISLADYALPLFDGDFEAPAELPDNAVKLKRMISLHHGVFIASPESSASVAPVLKNAIDWVARVREGREPPRSAFRNRVFALGSASASGQGGTGSLMALRQVLELGCGALVIPEQVSVARGSEAFDAMDELKDGQAAEQLKDVARRLVEVVRQMA
jgi:NAD(P)H-dependent FMN reductase